MKKNTKHRILGVVVVIALVIISLPFFQNEKDVATQASLVKAPPFPDQTVQVSAATPSSHTSETTLSQNSQATDTNNQPDDVISVTHPSVVNAQPPEMIKSPNIPAMLVAANEKFDSKASGAHLSSDHLQKIQANEIPAANISNAAAQVVQASLQKNAATSVAVKTSIPVMTPKAKLVAADVTKKSLPIAKHAHGFNFKTVADSTPATANEDGLFSLRNAAYVIQIGSFKNKTNALRLVNQLRANGYPAFIQKISTTFGENTRVFVGPESKRTSAHALADRLESDMHLRGIVISYQPLTL